MKKPLVIAQNCWRLAGWSWQFNTPPGWNTATPIIEHNPTLLVFKELNEKALTWPNEEMQGYW